MGSLTKGVFVIVLLSVVFTYLFNRVRLGQEQNRKEIYEGAVKMASEYATLNVLDARDMNALFDGSERDPMWLEVNYDAMSDCRKALNIYLEGKKNALHSGISGANVPLVGIVGYESICGELADGTWTVPMTYDYGIYNLDGSNKNIRFSLGTTVFVGDKIYNITNYKTLTGNDGSTIDCTELLNDNGLTYLQELRREVVMNTIGNYIGMHCGSEYNKTTADTEQGYSYYFERGTVSEYNGKGVENHPAYIEGIGVFVVIDIYTGNDAITGTPTQFTRAVSIGGAQTRYSLSS